MERHKRVIAAAPARRRRAGGIGAARLRKVCVAFKERKTGGLVFLSYSLWRSKWRSFAQLQYWSQRCFSARRPRRSRWRRRPALRAAQRAARATLARAVPARPTMAKARDRRAAAMSRRADRRRRAGLRDSRGCRATRTARRFGRPNRAARLRLFYARISRSAAPSGILARAKSAPSFMEGRSTSRKLAAATSVTMRARGGNSSVTCAADNGAIQAPRSP